MRRRCNHVNGEEFLLAALEEAEKGCGHTRPNPPVGAVVVRGGRIIGRGHHAYAGGDHAEVAAIKDCGCPVKGATLYVTLEPCSTAGRVGPCTEAVINAGIKRVVYACEDPDPRNRGRAERVLAQAGVECVRDVAFGERAHRLLRPFSKHVATGLPYVTVKLAMSLDGRICDRSGRAKWISSEGARAQTDRLRHRVDAIMVGAETIRRDNPTLLPHHGENSDLIRVVISRCGRLPPRAKVLTDGRNATLVYRDPGAALRELGRLGCLHVLCEGGMKLAVSMAQAGLVDEWMTVLAPVVIGERPLSKAVEVKEFMCLPDSFRG